jgi:16S rRNA (guanine527-N7)-methyltransferase
MDEKNLLSGGIDVICESDEEIKSLIAPNREKITAQIENYIKEIELFNSAYGLVGVSGTNELIIKHILDSLAPLGVILKLLKSVRAENTPQIADAGSGAGLPGIPLAITLPHCDFTLIERMGRRAGFLLNTKAVLSLSNVNIEESELEKTEKGRFNLVTFRAFKPLEPKLLKTLFSICAPGGIIAAYKGRREKIESEMSPIEKNCKNWEIIPCKTPFLEEKRHILVIRT